MAEEKKPEKKFDKKPEKPAPKKDDPFVEIAFLIGGAFVAIFLLNGFLGMFGSKSLISRGWQGLTPVGIMEAHTRSIASLANPIGVRVVSMKTTSVYNTPGEKKVGEHSFQDRGKILQGYVLVDGEKYWYVDYDNGVDGWVKEGDIAYLESEPTPVEKVILKIFSILGYTKIFSFILSVILILWFAYLIRELTKLRIKNREALYPIKDNNLVSDTISNPKWDKIESHLVSLNENDWKLAIIEADIMLNEIINKLSLPGDTMGEKMKAIEKSDFTTIDNAWEAHKIRNQIAHEGSDYILTQREAKRIIALYQTVFEEFQII